MATPPRFPPTATGSTSRAGITCTGSPVWVLTTPSIAALLKYFFLILLHFHQPQTSNNNMADVSNSRWEIKLHFHGLREPPDDPKLIQMCTRSPRSSSSARERDDGTRPSDRGTFLSSLPSKLYRVVTSLAKPATSSQLRCNHSTWAP